MDCLIKRIIRHICCLASQIEVVFCTNFLVKFVNVHVIFALGHRARCKFLASLLVAANFGDFGGDGGFSEESRARARARLSSPSECSPDTSSKKPAGSIQIWQKVHRALRGSPSPQCPQPDAPYPVPERLGMKLGKNLDILSLVPPPLPFCFMSPDFAAETGGEKGTRSPLLSFHKKPCLRVSKIPLPTAPFQNSIVTYPSTPTRDLPKGSQGVGENSPGAILTLRLLHLPRGREDKSVHT